MPEENTQESNDTKRWKGIKQDPKTKQYIVYITESTDRIFDSIDEAINYMVKVGSKNSLTKEAGSPEFSGVQRGQENIDGVKQVTITRKVVEGPDGKWKVKEKVRTDMIKKDEQDAATAYKDIDNAKEEADYVENPFEEEDKSEVEKESSVHPIGHCGQCGASIYPPGLTSEDMAPWFNRQIPADVLCPACGYGIGEPTNFIYANDEMNDEAVEKMASFKKEAQEEEFSMPLRDMYLEVNKELLLELLKDKGHELSEESALYLEYTGESNISWTFDISGNRYGIEYFLVNVPDQSIRLTVTYPKFYKEGDDDYAESEDVEVELEIPLTDIDTDIETVDMNRGTLYPSGLEVYKGSTATVIFNGKF